DNYAGGRDHDLKQIRMNRAAIEFAAEAVEEHGLEIYFNRAGKIHGAATPRGLKALAEFERHLASLGERFESLGADAMRRITGSTYYIFGTLTPGTVMIQPAGYIRGLAQGLSARVDIFENSPVVSIKTGSEHIVSTSAGEIRTPRLILTMNGQVESFGFFRRRLMHIFTFASMTRRLSRSGVKALGGQESW